MSRWKRLSIIFFLTVFCGYSGVIFSQETDNVFDFLKLPVSSRIDALGGENVSVVENDLSMIFHNPAFLGPEMNLDVNLGYVNYLADINAGSVAFAKSMGERSAWGVGVNYIDYGTFEGTDIENIYIGDISAKDICFNGFFSRDLTDRLRGGVAAKVIYSTFEQYTSVGLAVDVGLSYYNADKNFSAGLVGKNLGRQVKAYNEDRASLPWDIQIGMTQRLNHAPVRFSLTALHLTQWEFDSVVEGDTSEDSFFTTFFKHLVFGAEFLLSDNFWVGVGYNPKIGSDMSLETGNKLGGFSGGAGIRVKAFDIGVAVSKYHPSATSFHVNVTTSLSDFHF